MAQKQRKHSRSKSSKKSKAAEVARKPPERTEVHAAAAPVEDKPRASGLPIAGIGASAGGLDAFKRLFAAMPADSGIAFVLVPHLDPVHESFMVELLVRETSLPVVEAKNGLRVEADHVYVIPPNKYLTMQD